MTEDLPLSGEAFKLYQFFDDLVTDDWRSVQSFDAVVAPLARWLPQEKWRVLWHELGVHRLIAHSVRSGVDCISKWRHRYPTDASVTLLSNKTLESLGAYYIDWQPFDWDRWNDHLILVGIQTEALWQLNNAYLILANAGHLESRNRGTEIRILMETPNVD